MLSGLAVVLLFCLPLAPEIAGRRRLVFRDAHVTHWPWRRVAMASLDRGEVPFVNEYSSGGQPMLANPNELSRFEAVYAMAEEGTFAIDGAVARPTVRRCRGKKRGPPVPEEGGGRTRRRRR